MNVARMCFIRICRVNRIEIYGKNTINNLKRSHWNGFLRPTDALNVREFLVRAYTLKMVEYSKRYGSRIESMPSTLLAFIFKKSN